MLYSCCFGVSNCPPQTVEAENTVARTSLCPFSCNQHCMWSNPIVEVRANICSYKYKDMQAPGSHPACSALVSGCSDRYMNQVSCLSACRKILIFWKNFGIIRRCDEHISEATHDICGLQVALGRLRNRESFLWLTGR